LIEQVKQTEFDIRLDEASIKIGGRCEKFVPNINASKWDDEAFFNVNHSDVVSNEKETFVDGKIEIGVGERIHRYYLTEKGDLEYEVQFAKRPANNYVDLIIKHSENLKIYYQDTLENNYKCDPFGYKTLEDYLLHHHRPDKVEGSYVIRIRKSGNQYKAGRFGIIYRPKAIDADGNEIWCPQELTDIARGEKRLRITVDWNWLDHARYPVRLDPEFGYHTIGETGWNTDSYKFLLNDPDYDNPTGDGIATKGWLALGDDGGHTWDKNFGVGFYDADDALEDSADKTSGFSSDVDGIWNSVDLTGAVSVTTTESHRAAFAEDTGYGTLFYDDGVAWDSKYESGGRPLPDTWTSESNIARDYSVYIEVTAGGATAHELAGTVAIAGTFGGKVYRLTPVAGSFGAEAEPTGSVIRNRIVSGTTAAVSALSGTVNRTFGIVGSFATVAALAGSTVVNKIISGSLAAAGALSGTGIVGKTISGAFATVAATTGRLSLLKTIQGSFATVGAFVGTATKAGQIELQGVIAATTSFAAKLNVGKIIAGAIAATGDLVGAVIKAGQIELHGVIAASTAFTARVSTSKIITGAIAAVGNLVGAVTETAETTLAGAISATSALSARINLRKTFVGVFDAVAAFVGAVSTDAAASGLVTVSFISTVPAVAFSEAVPEVGFTSKKPDVSFS